MKPTPILEELKIAAEAAMVAQESEAYDLMDEDVIPNINGAITRHKKLCKVLREALAWCKQDATNEASTLLDARVHVLTEAIKLAKE